MTNNVPAEYFLAAPKAPAGAGSGSAGRSQNVLPVTPFAPVTIPFRFV
jgi:hypothetical protein